MYAGFDQNEAEFTVLVFAVLLEVFADCDSLQSISASFYLLIKNSNSREWDSKDDATFLINMYRSSGISGARPVT